MVKVVDQNSHCHSITQYGGIFFFFFLNYGRKYFSLCGLFKTDMYMPNFTYLMQKNTSFPLIKKQYLKIKHDRRK